MAACCRECNTQFPCLNVGDQCPNCGSRKPLVARDWPFELALRVVRSPREWLPSPRKRVQTSR